VIFLALDAQRARLVRSYLGGAQAIFATSLVYVSADPLANFELNGVYFVDMPWLLSPDHPAVLAYARQAQSSLEFQRFYALGIDAYRLAQDLLKATIGRATLDGVTGTISPAREHRFMRESLPAQFNQGETRTLSDTLRRPNG
jgi:outer membrane PBP1 activator LpoA protein